MLDLKCACRLRPCYQRLTFCLLHLLPSVVYMIFLADVQATKQIRANRFKGRQLAAHGQTSASFRTLSNHQAALLLSPSLCFLQASQKSLRERKWRFQPVNRVFSLSASSLAISLFPPPAPFGELKNHILLLSQLTWLKIVYLIKSS